MDNNELYFALKDRPTDKHQMDTDAIAASLRTMTQHLDKLHPEMQSVFGKITGQMQTHLDNLRQQRHSAYEFFSGQGPVARKLREHAAMMELFNPTNTARAANFRTEIDEVFNKFPTKNEEKLKELLDFIRMTFPLMTGQQLDGQEFEEIESDIALPKMKSGFYKVKSVVLPRMVMVLNATAPQGISASYVLEMGREEILLFKHPEENEWLKADGSFTFDYLVPMLQEQLDALIVPMGFQAARVDLDAEMQKIYAKVIEIFENRNRLPNDVEHVYNDDEETRITMPVTPLYHWVFSDTRGVYPNRTFKLFRKIGPHLQTADAEGFNEFSRQNMVKFLNLRLDAILGALVPQDATESI